MDSNNNEAVLNCDWLTDHIPREEVAHPHYYRCAQNLMPFSFLNQSNGYVDVLFFLVPFSRSFQRTWPLRVHTTSTTSPINFFKYPGTRQFVVGLARMNHEFCGLSGVRVAFLQCTYSTVQESGFAYSHDWKEQVVVTFKICLRSIHTYSRAASLILVLDNSKTHQNNSSWRLEWFLYWKW